MQKFHQQYESARRFALPEDNSTSEKVNYTLSSKNKSQMIRKGCSLNRVKKFVIEYLENTRAKNIEVINNSELKLDTYPIDTYFISAITQYKEEIKAIEKQLPFLLTEYRKKVFVEDFGCSKWLTIDLTDMRISIMCIPAIFEN